MVFSLNIVQFPFFADAQESDVELIIIEMSANANVEVSSQDNIHMTYAAIIDRYSLGVIKHWERSSGFVVSSAA